MVKLVDTLASGASARKGVEVQVLSWAPLTAKNSAYLSRHIKGQNIVIDGGRSTL